MCAVNHIPIILTWWFCDFAGGFYTRVLNILRSLTVLFPTRIEIIPHEFVDRTSYRKWLLESGLKSQFTDPRVKDHATSPFCWLEKPCETNNFGNQGPDPKAEDIEAFLGGHDDTLAWCRSFMAPCEEKDTNGIEMEADGYTADHGYDYDLIVIGGGSGGMAVSRFLDPVTKQLSLIFLTGAYDNLLLVRHPKRLPSWAPKSLVLTL